MITLYTWDTPNGRKISIALEEMGLAYQVKPIDIGANAQFAPDFLALNPNHKIPVLVDDEAVVNESGAILLYLAEKTGQFAPDRSDPDYWEMMRWLMWQMGGQGPMLGQAHHFLKFNPGKAPYAEERFGKEAQRLYGILDRHLTGREFILNDLSICEFAIWPWVSRFEFQQIDLFDYPAVRDWYERLADRPAFQRGYSVPSDVGAIPRS
ncbi:MAG: glutathione S-transferase N-terminal domain-containing protein [Pseudomonadota bacterium]|nr:glutathione S-transferase N-terminal domain-containing protein [Pseudomonadota bacterium]